MSSVSTVNTPAPSETTSAEWSPLQRIVFRFVVVYFALYLLPYVFHFYAFPGTAAAGKMLDGFWGAVVPWVGIHLLRLGSNFPTYSSGGGDSLFDFTRTLCYVMLAVLATLIWTIADKKTTRYQRFYDLLRVYVRYSLAIIMLSYGMAKIFNGQFPSPGLATLMSPYGASSGQDLLWTFMGYSRPYTFFAGAIETVGAVMLFFRRTTLLGALILFAALANVVVLNFSYDVDIKMFSSHLLLLSIFLLAPDLSRLGKLLVFNQPTAAGDVRIADFPSWIRMGRVAAKSLLIGYAFFSTITPVLANQKKRIKPPLYGIWQVEEFSRNGQSVPPLTTESERWRYAIFDSGLAVKRMDDSFRFYRDEYDQAANTATISAKGQKGVFSYSRSDPDHLTLAGTIGSESLAIKMERVDESKMRLIRHEFRWVRFR